MYARVNQCVDFLLWIYSFVHLFFFKINQLQRVLV